MRREAILLGLVGVLGVLLGSLLWNGARSQTASGRQATPSIDPLLNYITTRDDGTGYKQTMDQIRVMLTKGNLNRFDVEDLIAVIQRPTPILGVGDASQAGLSDHELGVINSSDAALSNTAHYVRAGYPIDPEARQRFLEFTPGLLRHTDPFWRLKAVVVLAELGRISADSAVRQSIEALADHDENPAVRNRAYDALAALNLRPPRLR